MKKKALLVGVLAAALVLVVSAVALGLTAGAMPRSTSHSQTGCPSCHYSTYPPSIPPLTARPAGHQLNPDCSDCHRTDTRTPPPIQQGAMRPHANYGTCTTCHTMVVAPPPVPVTRIAGSSRYATAIEVSKSTFAGPVDGLVIATGANYPDALCAAPLARAYRGPVLLTAGPSMSASLTAELTRLRPGRIFIAGGEGAVAPGVEAALRALPWSPQVTRLGGTNRYATAALVAAEVKAKLGTVGKVVVASGAGFADALAAAPLAAAKGWPILLSGRAALAPETAAAVASLAPTSSMMVGGTGALSDAVKAALPNCTRVDGAAYGADRYATCAGVADVARQNGMTYSRVGIATGVNYPDALSAGPMLAARGNVLLLVPGSSTVVPGPISGRLSANKASVTAFDVIGGTGAVSEGCLGQMGTFLR